MPAILHSLEDTIAHAEAQLGKSWPNPWWPHGVPAFNDCAAFVSWNLWGLNGDAPFETVVSGIIDHSGLPFHAGTKGIQRGDILGLRWASTVNYDHIGIALGPANAAGVVQTIDANGGSNKVAYSNRSISNVHNFVRPNYPTLSTASDGSIPISNTTSGSGDTDMRVIHATTGDIQGAIARIGAEIGVRPYAFPELSIASVQAKLDNPANLYSNAAAGAYWVDVTREEYIVLCNEANAAFAVSHPAQKIEDADLVAKIVAALPPAPAGQTLDEAAITKGILDGLHDRLAG